jgi:hypothetical protein
MVLRRPKLVILFLLISLVGVGGIQAKPTAKPVKWMRGIYMAESPVPQAVPEAIAKSVADTVAREVGGAAIRGTGNSMQPLYNDGVIMVVAPTDFENLKRGQTVVYKNREGRHVAHVLVAKCKTGWRVTGLNNRTHDGQGVNAANLHGVVVDAFQPVTGTSLASR